MENPVCLITGANAGIGKETALALAQKKFTVVMLCRSLEKAQAARQEIIQQSGNTNIHIIQCDLNDLKSVEKAAEAFNQDFPALHVLINNAGFMSLEKRTSANNFEATLAVNYLAHVYLTQLLLDKLKASAPARIINVSSSAHKMAKLDCNDLMLEHVPYKGFTAYGNSKLANILFTYSLARHLRNTQVTVNALDPGMVKTEFGDKVQFPLSMRMFTFFLRPWVKTAPQGALTTIKLASDPGVANISGQFWKNEQPATSSEISQDMALQQQLWESTQALLKPFLPA